MDIHRDDKMIFDHDFHIQCMLEIRRYDGFLREDELEPAKKRLMQLSCARDSDVSAAAKEVLGRRGWWGEYLQKERKENQIVGIVWGIIGLFGILILYFIVNPFVLSFRLTGILALGWTIVYIILLIIGIGGVGFCLLLTVFITVEVTEQPPETATEKRPVNDYRKSGAPVDSGDAKYLALRSQLKSEGYETMMAAANRFGEEARTSPGQVGLILPTLIDDIRSYDSRMSSGAVMALMKISEANPSVLMPFIENFLSFVDGSATERPSNIMAQRGAVYILGLIGGGMPNQVISHLTRYQNDPDEYVRKNARESIQRLSSG